MAGRSGGLAVVACTGAEQSLLAARGSFLPAAGFVDGIFVAGQLG